jgi:hypothetical protein
LFSQEAKIVFTPNELTSQIPTVIRFDIYPPKEIKVGGMIIIDKLFRIFNAVTGDSLGAIAINRSDMKNETDGAKVWIKKEKHVYLWSANISIEKKPLSQGDYVSLVLGDSKNSFFVTRKTSIVRIPISFVYETGNKTETHLLDTNLKIRNSETVGLSVVGPSYAEKERPIDIRVSAYDNFMNVCEDYQEELVISVFSAEEPDNRKVRMRFLMKDWDRKNEFWRNSFALSFSSPGVYYILVEDSKNNINGISNPIKITKERQKSNLYWGDIHIHTMRSDGLGEVFDCYKDAYTHGCDFCAVTDHNLGTRDRGSFLERVNKVIENADRFNRPGEYITLIAGEFHGLKKTHLNTYFNEVRPTDFMEIIKIFYADRTSQPEESTRVSDDFWKNIISDYPKFPLIFTHHSLWMADINDINDERMRLIEIYSIHGSSEERGDSDVPKKFLGKEKMGSPDFENVSIREVLNAGNILGFIASSDSHSGQPGRDALAAVWSPELTRNAILNALYDRSCYGTTGNRTIIEFSVNGSPMGSILPREKTKELDFDVFVAGDGLIKKIDIIGTGKTAHTVEGEMKRVISFQWSDDIPPFPAYYYIRVLLEDGIAWSSPVWIR